MRHWNGFFQANLVWRWSLYCMIILFYSTRYCDTLGLINDLESGTIRFTIYTYGVQKSDSTTSMLIGVSEYMRDVFERCAVTVLIRMEDLRTIETLCIHMEHLGLEMPVSFRSDRLAMWVFSTKRTGKLTHIPNVPRALHINPASTSFPAEPISELWEIPWLFSKIDKRHIILEALLESK